MKRIVVVSVAEAVVILAVVLLLAGRRHNAGEYINGRDRFYRFSDGVDITAIEFDRDYYACVHPHGKLGHRYCGYLEDEHHEK